MLHLLRGNFVQYANHPFTGLNDRDFLAKQNKTYVIDRKGGYPRGSNYNTVQVRTRTTVRLEKVELATTY